VHLLLLLFLRHSACILLAQSPPDGASLLGSKVEREVLLAGIEFAESVALVGVDHSQAAGDRFAEVVTDLLKLKLRANSADQTDLKLTFSSILRRRLLQSSARAMCRARSSGRRVAS
jgi:hypothetical protein